jgi:hypothetical protein
VTNPQGPDGQYPRCTFVLNSPDSLTVCFGGLNPRVTVRLAGQRTDIQLMARNGDLVAKLLYREGPPRLEVDVGDRETFNAMAAVFGDVPDPQAAWTESDDARQTVKFMTLCPSATDFFLAISSGA